MSGTMGPTQTIFSKFYLILIKIISIDKMYLYEEGGAPWCPWIAGFFDIIQVNPDTGHSDILYRGGGTSC